MKVAAQQNLTKKRKKLEKLKDQRSKTAGFETVLSLAVGCRVILRCNIDVTVGLVNGAIVSNLCINEINRQRSKFQKDLPQIKKSKGKKRKIQVTGIIDDGEPCNLKTKFNVKDDDSCSSLIASIKLSNIKCKQKDNKTKCVVKNDHCSSGLIVSMKLSSIKLKTSNPKKNDDVIFTFEEPPNPDIV
uniref:Uncharacterized protein n=1 Tax=Amphimedon queenslandica TaxID=400682 RepID=A0A1X7UJK9_AMPQE